MVRFSGWALTFPNGMSFTPTSQFVILSKLTFFIVGWIATIRALGDIFNLNGFFVWHTVMAVLIVTVWVILIVFTIMAFWKGKIFYAKDEDVIKDTVGDAPKKQSESSSYV